MSKTAINIYINVSCAVWKSAMHSSNLCKDDVAQQHTVKDSDHAKQ